MKKSKSMFIATVMSIIFSLNVYAKDMYNFTESVYIAKEHVTLKREQTIHKTGKVFWLKLKVKTIEHRTKKSSTKYFYKCWTGNKTPYENLSQSWMTTNQKLDGCPTNLPLS